MRGGYCQPCKASLLYFPTHLVWYSCFTQTPAWCLAHPSTLENCRRSSSKDVLLSRPNNTSSSSTSSYRRRGGVNACRRSLRIGPWKQTCPRYVTVCFFFTECRLVIYHFTFSSLCPFLCLCQFQISNSPRVLNRCNPSIYCTKACFLLHN